MALNEKRARFIKEFLVDLNASQAAVRAGYSPKTARQQGSRLLSDADIQEAVAAAQKARSERTKITADRVVRELALIAFADLGTVMQWGPEGISLKNSASLTPEQSAIVSEVVQTRDGIRVKLHNKLDALGKLGQHLGIFKPEAQSSAEDPIAELLRQIDGTTPILPSMVCQEGSRELV